jgi:hypothetical protein
MCVEDYQVILVPNNIDGATVLVNLGPASPFVPASVDHDGLNGWFAGEWEWLAGGGNVTL